VLSGKSYADIYDEIAEGAGINEAENALDSNEKEIAGNLDLAGNYNVGGAIERLLKKTIETAEDKLKSEFSYIAQIIVITALGSICLSVSDKESIFKLVNISVCAALAQMLVLSDGNIFTAASDAIVNVNDYSHAAMPSIYIVAAAGGAYISAPLKYSAASLGIDVLTTISNDLIIPLIYAFTGVGICKAMFPNSALSAISRTLKWCSVTLMTATVLVFTVYLNLTGLIAGSTDAVAIKGAKTIISTAVPVIGGIISDASATILSAASIVRNSVGAFCLIAVCAICIVPFVALGIKYLLFKLAAAVVELTPCTSGSALLSDLGTAYGLLLGLLGSNVIMVFISFAAAMKAVS